MRGDGVAAHRAGHTFEAMGLFRRARDLDAILDETFGTGPCQRCGAGDMTARICDDCSAELRAGGFVPEDRRFLEALDDEGAARVFLRRFQSSEIETTGDAVADARALFFAKFDARRAAVSL